jgi:phage head maturation protease
MTELERRLTLMKVDLRAAGERPKIGGYAMKFNTLSRNLGGFVERIDPRFPAKTRGDGWPDIMARYNHDNNMLLGTTGGGTLVLRIDEIGVDYEVSRRGPGRTSWSSSAAATSAGRRSPGMRRRRRTTGG